MSCEQHNLFASTPPRYLRLDISIYNLQCMAAQFIWRSTVCSVQIARAARGSHTSIHQAAGSMLRVAAPAPHSPALHSLIPPTKTMLRPTRRRHMSSWNECNNNMFCARPPGVLACWRWRGLVMMNKCDSIDRAEEVTGGAPLAHCPTVSTTIANITSVSQILPI